MASKRRGKQRKYSPEERRLALADVMEFGQGGAARRHGIPVKTLGHWARTEERRIEAPGEPAEPGSELELRLRPAMEKGVAGSRRVARVYTPSEKAQVVEYASAAGVSAASKRFGVSRFTIYDWLARVKKAAAGQGPSPTSGEDPKVIGSGSRREQTRWRVTLTALSPGDLTTALRYDGRPRQHELVDHELVIAEDGGGQWRASGVQECRARRARRAWEQLMGKWPTS